MKALQNNNGMIKETEISFFPKNNSYIVCASGFHYEVTENDFECMTAKGFASIFNKLSPSLTGIPKFVYDFVETELS